MFLKAKMKFFPVKYLFLQKLIPVKKSFLNPNSQEMSEKKFAKSNSREISSPKVGKLAPPFPCTYKLIAHLHFYLSPKFGVGKKWIKCHKPKKNLEIKVFIIVLCVLMCPGWWVKNWHYLWQHEYVKFSNNPKSSKVMNAHY